MGISLRLENHNKAFARRVRKDMPQRVKKPHQAGAGRGQVYLQEKNLQTNLKVSFDEA